MKSTDRVLFLVIYILFVSVCSAQADCDTDLVTVTDENGVICTLNRTEFPNGNFESGDKYWDKLSPYGFIISDEEAVSGSNSMKIELPSEFRGGGLQVISFDYGKEPNMVIIQAYSKAIDVSGTEPDSFYSVTCEVTNTLNISEGTYSVNFSTGTHDWEQQTMVIKSAGDPCIAKLACECRLMFKTGTVYFDDISLEHGTC